MKQPIEVDDAIVLMLGAQRPGPGSGEIKGITRLEKLFFLLERETSSRTWLQETAEFEPYNFGPFSKRVYQAVDTLSAAQIVRDSKVAGLDNADDTWEARENIGFESGLGGNYVTRDFALTERGWRYFDALKSELKPAEFKELSAFMDRFGKIPLRQLVRYVYERYESFTTKSLIRDDVLGLREE